MALVSAELADRPRLRAVTVASVSANITYPRTVRSHRTTGLAVVLLTAVTVAVWVALVRLGWAFFTERLDWRYVAEQSRVDATWYYRVAGVWGGMEGSLLLFAGIVGIVATVAARRAVLAAAQWFALATVVALVAVDLALASPFGRLDVPAVGGFGLTPILEHPAMTIHPPLLYVGLAMALGALVVGAGSADALARAGPWLLAAVGLLTAAMTLGAAWSYLEQGWGGYWAWDPVENTSLLVWLAALLALHGAPMASNRTATALVMAPWALAVVGAVLVRSGVTPSVHGFAEQRAVGWALAVLAAATVAVAVLFVLRTPAGDGGRRLARDPRPVTVIVVGATVVIVLAGTLAPLASELVGDRSSAVRGEFYSRTVGPLALVALPFLAARVRRWHGWSTLAHGGALVLLAGIAASTFDRAATVPIAAGATVHAAGVEVVNDGVRVTAGPRAGTDAVVADLRVDGSVMRPALVVYPDRGGRLAEVAASTGALTDVQATLENASDDGGVVVTVHIRHLMWLVWLGAAAVAFAAMAQAVASRLR
jgi:cytochrome c biogenesis factor